MSTQTQAEVASTPEELDQLEAYLSKLTDHLAAPDKGWDACEDEFNKLSEYHKGLAKELVDAINEYLK